MGLPARIATAVRARISKLLSAVAIACLTACVGGYSATEKVQEAAQNLNMATRLGRMDIALEGVSAEAKADFAKRHAGWGQEIRIVDYEFQGLMMRDKETAEVFIMVAWHRVDEAVMRTTSLVQRWKDFRGTWLLVEEERAGGDVGLLGENTVVVRPPRRDVQFESVTIK